MWKNSAWRDGLEQRARGTVQDYLLGPVRNDIVNVNKLAQGLKARFRLSDEAVTKVMKMAPVVIKKEATLSEAQQYKEALEAIGAKVQLEPIQSAPIEEEQGQLQQTEGGPSSLEREPQVIPVKGKTLTRLRRRLRLRRRQGLKWLRAPSVGLNKRRRMNVPNAALSYLNF